MGDETKEPPRLDGEVWRGVVPDCAGYPCAVTRDGLQPKAWAWCAGTWEHARYADSYGWGAAIFAAWALHERDRAERAEKIAAAERELRKAGNDARAARVRFLNARPSARDAEAARDAHLDAGRALTEAESALRALGVEP